MCATQASIIYLFFGPLISFYSCNPSCPSFGFFFILFRRYAIKSKVFVCFISSIKTFISTACVRHCPNFCLPKMCACARRTQNQNKVYPSIETKFKKMLAESENDVTKLSKHTIPATILCTSTYTRLWQELFTQY